MAGKGGGAWKVAYADFVTAMMAFFLVMWIVAQSQQVREAVAQSFNDPFGSVDEQGHDEHSKHRRDPHASHPGRTHGAGTGHALLINQSKADRTAIGTVVRFADDSTELDAEGRRRLDELIPLLAGKPQKIEIRGHSSRRPLATDDPHGDHWQLSFERAAVVMRYLEARGVARERIRLSQAAGYEPPPGGRQGDPAAEAARVEVNLLNETVSAAFSSHYQQHNEQPAAMPAPALTMDKH